MAHPDALNAHLDGLCAELQAANRLRNSAEQYYAVMQASGPQASGPQASPAEAQQRQAHLMRQLCSGWSDRYEGTLHTVYKLSACDFATCLLGGIAYLWGGSVVFPLALEALRTVVSLGVEQPDRNTAHVQVNI